jgi:hypothetical protein
MPVAPLLSVATAVSEYLPAATPDQVNEYGDTADVPSSAVPL